MSRAGRAVVGTALCLLVLVATPFYEPLHSGEDDGWAIAASIVLAHLATGAAVSGPAALALPVLFCLGGFVASGAEGLAWLVLVLGLPALLAVTVAGWGLGRLARGGHVLVGAVCVALAAAPAAWAGVEQLRRGPHVPPDVQAALPTDVSLRNLCSSSETDAATLRDVRRRARRLALELRRRPQELVTYTYYSSDDGPEERDITVREVVEEQLRELGGCDLPIGSLLREGL